MRRLIIAFTILLLLAPSAGAHQAPQDHTALERLPAAESIGSDWSVLTADTVTDRATHFRDAATATYGGPNGARAYVAVLLVAEGMTAIRDSWELSNGYFESYRTETDYDFDSRREQDLEARPLPDGCADARRTFGSDKALGDDFPVGITLCAADPDMIILTYASEEIDGLTGYLASDRLVELALDQADTGTPSPS